MHGVLERAENRRKKEHKWGKKEKKGEKRGKKEKTIREKERKLEKRREQEGIAGVKGGEQRKGK